MKKKSQALFTLYTELLDAGLESITMIADFGDHPSPRQLPLAMLRLTSLAVTYWIGCRGQFAIL